MALERDRDSELTGVSRLLARLRDYRQRQLLTPDEWCLGMVAFAISEVERLDFPGEEFLPLYAQFEHAVSSQMRSQALARLCSFVAQRRGKAWRALSLFAVAERDDFSLACRAAAQTALLAPRQGEGLFVGVHSLVQFVLSGQGEAAAVITGLLAPADLRLLPELTALHNLPTEQLAAILPALRGQLNSLSSAWLLPLAQRPQLTEPLILALQHLVASTELVADIIYPIPSWEFKESSPRPLHAWSYQTFYSLSGDWNAGEYNYNLEHYVYTRGD